MILHPIMPIDPEEMKMAADASWLCAMFQKNLLSKIEKQIILRSMFKEHKLKRLQEDAEKEKNLLKK